MTGEVVDEFCGYCGPWCRRCYSVPRPEYVHRTNRHDRQRKLGGKVLKVSAYVWDKKRSSYLLKQPQTVVQRTVGQEWYLMCRRILGAVDFFPVNHGNHYADRTYRATNGARKTEILRAIAMGGWEPPPDVEGRLGYNAQTGTGNYTAVVNSIRSWVNNRWRPGKRNRRVRGIGY